MQKLLSLTNPNYRNSFSRNKDGLETQTTDLFALDMEPLKCFITVSNFPDDAGSGYYSTLFIHDTSKKIFEFDVMHDITKFDEKLYDHLSNKCAKQCSELFYKHGCLLVSNSTFNLERLLKQQGLFALPTEISDLLDAEAIKILQSIQLGIVPKLYNWLLEGNELQRQRRAIALQQYPILLVSFLCPTTSECYPEDSTEIKHISETMAVIQQMSQRIDDGEQVEMILTDIFNVSVNTMAEIKDKSFKDITHENNPKLFGQFQDGIEIYCQIATFL